MNAHQRRKWRRLCERRAAEDFAEIEDWCRSVQSRVRKDPEDWRQHMWAAAPVYIRSDERDDDLMMQLLIEYHLNRPGQLRRPAAQERPLYGCIPF